MPFKTLSVTITGAAPLLMHNGQLADPLNPFARAIKSVSGRRKKTDADIEELGRLEFIGGLWLSGGEPCVPGEVLEAAIVDGARRTREGRTATASVLCPGMYALTYEGPRDPDALWAEERFRLRVPVRVQQAKVVRTRARFAGWSCAAAIEFNEELANGDAVLRWLRTAGEQVGVGDWRPRFGRFAVQAN